MSDGGFSDEWRQLSPRDLAAALAEQVTVMRQEMARTVALLAYADQRGVTGELGYGSAGDLYAVIARVPRKDGCAMAARARALHGDVTLTGAEIEASLPRTAEVFATGEIGTEHVDRIRRFHDSLPAAVDAEAFAVAEDYLATASRETTPQGLTGAINRFRARLDQDGTFPKDRDLASPDRALHTRWHGDRLELHGHLDREAGMLLEATLDPLAKPRPAHDGELDVRSGVERHGDALAELVGLAARSERLGKQAGEPVTVMVTMQETDLRDGTGNATTLDGAAIPAAQLRRMACDAELIPAVLGADGGVIDLGDKRRLANARLRRALVLRDGGCAHPHCDAPASRTQVHHIKQWADRGGTDKKNTVLLCAYHHRQINHTEWSVHIERGVPVFQPPEYLQPQWRKSTTMRC